MVRRAYRTSCLTSYRIPTVCPTVPQQYALPYPYSIHSRAVSASSSDSIATGESAGPR